MKFDAPVNTLIKSVGRPPFIYGTAWKKENSNRLVAEALCAGFTAIDTAAQPKHYREDLVLEGVKQFLQSKVLNSKGLKREDLYIQTKYTPVSGQLKENMPYDASSPIPTQIHTSIASSLRNFAQINSSTSPKDDPAVYIDCLVIHSPLDTLADTMQAWTTLETYVPHKIRTLGISNTSLEILQAVHAAAKIKPSVVQNRFYPSTGHDVALRKFCRENEIAYQSFWTLTGNPELLGGGAVTALAKEASVGKAVALYSLVIGLGWVSPLNGTTSLERMQGDLKGVELVRNWGLVYRERWEEILSEFRASLGEES